MLLVAVLSTAAFVHFTWQRTASENVERIVSRLDAQRASTVRADLSATFAVLGSTAEIVRSILFQGTIKADDEVKREFLFLSLLELVQQKFLKIMIGEGKNNFIIEYNEPENRLAEFEEEQQV